LKKTISIISCILLFGCDGVIGGSQGPDPSYTDAFICGDSGEIALGSAPVRRLTNSEYDNTVRELFGDELPTLPEQPSDAVSEGSFENQALALGPSDVRITRYFSAAETLGRFAVENRAARERVLPCEPKGQDDEADCAAQFVDEFGKRVFRRPLTDDEYNRWIDYFEQQRADIDFDAAVQLTVTALLQAPQFVYRLESTEDVPKADDAIELSPHELATRLAYFFWERGPDEELMRAADEDELSSPEQIEKQARRLLGDDRARATIRNFHRQWLHLDRVLGEDKLPEQFPNWNEQVREAALEESLLFAESIVFGGGTLRDLLTSNVGFIDSTLAPLYDVEPPAYDWEPVELDPEHRAGILSRIAFLAGNAHAGNGSPPLRGVAIMERLLCEPRPSPPADADLSPPTIEPGQGPLTNRELFEIRTSPPQCQACHVRIDGFGFGFEEFDAAGQYRDTDNGLPVDASGYADGTGNDDLYEGAAELQELLSESEAVHGCMTEKWLTYALGRALEPADACQLETLTQGFIESGGNIEELLVSIALRPEFRLRPQPTE
jgi:hypothetical protein